MRTETEFHFRKGRLLFLSVLTLFLVVSFGAITAAAVSEGVLDNPLILLVVAIFGPLVVFLFAVFAWAFARMLGRAPALVVEDRGLTDHSNMFGVGFVPWTNIVDARQYELRGGKSVMVVLKDPKAVLRGQPFAKALGIRINGMMSVTPMWISTFALPVSIDELIAIIRERARGQPV